MTQQPPGDPDAYDVVVLVEQALSDADARQVVGLHETLAAQGTLVRYHLLLPAEDAAVRVSQ